MSSSWKKQRLQDHFVLLCNELDVSRILPVLRAERMLTSDEMDQLTNTVYTTRQRREKLLLFIPHKGRSHFEKFAECLVWSGQDDLARKIGVPVENIRPSPHPLPAEDMEQQSMLRKIIHLLGVEGQDFSQPSRQPHPPPPYQVQPHPHQDTTHTHPHPHPHPHPYTHPYTHPSAPPHYPTNDPPPIPTPRPPNPSTPPLPTPPLPTPVLHVPTPVLPSCKDLFILYCNDEKMHDFSDEVLALADFLTLSCGQTMKIHCDVYDDFPVPRNWTQWTEERITESNVVLFVCSPTLITMLTNRHVERPIQMKRGHVDADAVYNLIKSPKFVPVFLNDDGPGRVPDLHTEPYSSWVPSKLRGTSRYWLDLKGLKSAVGETNSDDEYRNQLERVLERNFEPITALLRRLRQTPGTQPPAPFPTPIAVPPPAAYPVQYATPVQATSNPVAQVPQSEPFTELQLKMIAQRIPRDWQNVGIKLGVMWSTLESIRVKHAFDCERAAMEMFNVWRRKKGEQATRAVLKDALMCVGYGRLVEDVFGSD